MPNNKDVEKRREVSRVYARKMRANPETKKVMYERTKDWANKPENAEKRRERRRQHAKENSAILREKRKIYRANNREKINKYKAESRLKNIEAVRIKERASLQLRLSTVEGLAALRKRQKDYRLRNRDKSLYGRYGLTREEWFALFALQDECCAICKSPHGGPKGFFHTDHCHKTNKVRGILCHRCNLMLGLAKDSVQTLLSAIEYLNPKKKANPCE
jgi:hypothetical protein